MMLPREKLTINGEKSLSDQEIIAILLRTGHKGEDVITLAGNLLKNFGGLQGIAKAGVKELATVTGMGNVKAVTLKAAFELCRRMEIEKQEIQQVSSPKEAYSFIKPHIWNNTREQLAVIILDSKNRIIRWELLGIGSGNGVVITPREIFITAIKEGGISIILAHNHPSGDPTPSKADIDFTKRVAKAGDVIGISLLDHIVIGANNYRSMKMDGIL